MLSNCSENSVTETIRHYVGSPNLNYTWSRCTGQCQQCARIKIVCNYNTSWVTVHSIIVASLARGSPILDQ